VTLIPSSSEACMVPLGQVDGTCLPKHAPRPAAERRERRRAVAKMLLDGVPTQRVLERAAERFGVTPSAVRGDVRAVLASWRREDTRALSSRRSRVLRALERNARACRRAQDFGGERQALALLARLLGMVQPATTLALTQSSQQVVIGAEAVAAIRELQGTPTGRAALTAHLKQVMGVEAPSLEVYRRAALNPTTRAAAEVLLAAVGPRAMSPDRQAEDLVPSSEGEEVRHE